MTDIDDLLDELRDADVELWVDGADLSFRAAPGALTEDRRRRLLAGKDAVVARLTGAVEPAAGVPLSPAQRQIFFRSILQPDTPAFTIPYAVALEGPLDVPAFVHAFDSTVERHDAFRARFSSLEGRPVQRLAPSPEARLSVVDVSLLDGDTWSARLADELASIAAALDIERGPLIVGRLFRRADDEHILVVAVHHIVFDAGSLLVLLDDLQRAYRQPGATAPPTEGCRWLASMAAASTGQATGTDDLAYWVDQLADLAPPAGLARPSATAALGRPGAAGAVSFRIEPSRRSDLERRCRDDRATLFVALLATLAAALSRFAGERDLCIGSPVSTRRAEDAGVVGVFLNLLALRVDVDPAASLATLVTRSREVVLGALDHHTLPHERVLERLPSGRSPGGASIFQTLFSVQDGSSFDLLLPGVRCRPLPTPPIAPKFPLTAQATTTPDGAVEVVLEHDLEAIEGDLAAAFAAAWDSMITAYAAGDARPSGQLPLATPTELARQAEPRRVPDDRRWPDSALGDLVRRSFADRDDHVCLLAGSDHLTARGLLDAADRVAGSLRAMGVGLEDRVAVALRRDVTMLPVLLGIAKAGGAFVPLDPDLPVGRAREIVRVVGAALVVTELTLPSQPNDPPIVSPAALLGAGRRDALPVVPATAAATILFTSGSTGRPKGIVIEHRNLVSFLDAAAELIGPRALELGVASTKLSFDLSLFELLTPILGGGTTVLVTSPLEIAVEASCEQATLISLVPSTAMALVDVDGVPSDVQVVTLAGEPLRAPLVAAIAAQAAGAEVVNLYGPSEITVFATSARVPVGASPTIGGRLAPASTHVTDDDLQLQPDLVPGELVVGGLGVTRGYEANPRLTAERYRPDPFRSTPGARLYRTGDRCRFDREGALELFGRLDHQVKVRGCRIELDEVEGALRAQAGVADAVVLVADDDDPRRARLVGFVEGDPGDPLLVPRLRDQLKATLPLFMVPNQIDVLDHLPLNRNGKVDRTALEPRAGASSHRLGRLPTTASERALADIWSSVLGAPVTADQTFFEAGGNSLLILQVHHLLERDLGRAIALPVLFQHPTIAGLADHLDRGDATEPADTLPPRPRDRSAARRAADRRRAARVGSEVDR